MKKLLLLLCSATVLVGCNSGAKNAVKAMLKDDTSVKFFRFTEAKKDIHCLEFKAKNSFGVYSGYHQATLWYHDGEWHVVAIDRESHELCIEIGRQL